MNISSTYYTDNRFLPTDLADDNRLQEFCTVVGCSVYIGSGSPLLLLTYDYYYYLTRVNHIRVIVVIYIFKI